MRYSAVTHTVPSRIGRPIVLMIAWAMAALTALGQEPPYVEVIIPDVNDEPAGPEERMIVRNSPNPAYQYFLAKFYPFLPPCTFPCEGCAHGERTTTWTVTPSAPLSEIVYTDPAGTGEAATIRFNGHGLFTITYTVGELPQGECPEGYEHSGNHAGASNSITVIVWELQNPLTVSNSSPVRGESATISGVLLGGVTPITTFEKNGQTFHPWNWQAQTNVSGWTPASKNGQEDSWAGPLVANTTVHCTVRVQNPYAQNPNEEFATDDAQVTIQVQRRTDWTLAAPGTPTVYENWQDQESQFPEKSREDPEKPFIAYGQNTNEDDHWQEYDTLMIFPVYNDNVRHPEAYAAFDNVVAEVATGPNKGLWYNTDKTMYRCDRKVRINYWIKPDAGKPAVPNRYSFWTDYTNWIGLQKDLFEDTCTCSNPSLHSGVGNDVRWRANRTHEKHGPIGSPNKRKLGHQAQIEDVFDWQNYHYDNPEWEEEYKQPPYHPEGPDVLKRCEDNVAPSKEHLRTMDEVERGISNEVIYKAAWSLHHFITSDPAKHNFYGNLKVWIDEDPEDPHWETVQGAFGGAY